jgi:Arc/MetJ-type ribon-helix-helix transcriptional regulator
MANIQARLLEMSEWKTVSIRQELIKEIESIIKMGRYRSISEFISEAVRFRLEELTHTDATSARGHEEICAVKDETVKEAHNRKDEEHVQLQEQTTSQDTQSQSQMYQTQVPVQQKETEIIQD